MRGEVDPQEAMFSYVSPERRVPTDHPLRSIKAYADAALAAISPQLDELYGRTGRPSIAPERLLKGQLLIALYTVRSDRAFCVSGKAIIPRGGNRKIPTHHWKGASDGHGEATDDGAGSGPN